MYASRSGGGAVREVEALEAVWQRASRACEWCGAGRTLQVHHALPRGMGGTDLPHWNPARLRLLCRRHHDLAESRRRWATSVGLLIPRPPVPQLNDEHAERWPFLLLQRRPVLLTGTGQYVDTRAPLGELVLEASPRPVDPPEPPAPLIPGWPW
jgi:hypothetical protein